ncbi:PTS glucose transporter subunit IIA [Lactobacillus sp. ESL0791]|uniref:PTS sugar transporter subunit IIA n=1 Tax=Lactobacillus sp. ESL0791 TaxID=2983234 RepID=UPI0023F86DD0|nr:PTS glucose transporter subunit IIA [Lactobacillus sp. ESL0791]MDF7639624.1 PTS glucose transporter subunit IIA [Lactobacillus sp. ESL0791]
MFGLHRKNSCRLYAPVSGEVIPVEQVADDVFSQKMMGDGFAVVPTESQIYAPVTGKIVSVFPTKHAIGIKTDSGLEVLVHLGLDTVELKGEPFKNMVAVDQRVTEKTIISQMDIDAIKKAGYDPTVVVVFTNMKIVKEMTPLKMGKTTHSSVIGEIKI